MKRSHEPIFWSLFGAGGVLSALIAPILIFITGIITPIGVWMPPQALDYARQSLENAPDELKQFPLAALGWVHYKRKEFDKAIDFLARSSELGTSSNTLTHLGMALLASGDEEKAKNVLARARSLESRRGGLEDRMMECMRDSTRILERVRRGQRK